MSPHPLMEIQLWFMDPIAPPEIVTRHWYHVPRIGDEIEVAVMTGGFSNVLSGTVKSVLWLDGDVVKVVL